MITLWRVDAIHDLGGEMTHFYEDAEAAENCAEQLITWGWDADAYPESIERAPPATLHELLNRPHPTAPTPTLLSLAWLDTLDDDDGLQQCVADNPEQAATRLGQLFEQMAVDLGLEVVPDCLRGRYGDDVGLAVIEITCDP